MKLFSLYSKDTNNLIRNQWFDNEAPVLSPEKNLEWREFIEPPVVPVSIEEVRRNKIQMVNGWKIAQETTPAPIEHEGNYFDADPKSREKIQMVLLAGVNSLGYWTSANNVDVPFTIGDLQDLFGKILLLGAQIHARQREMKTEIAALTTAQEINDYHIGWSIE